MNYSQNFEVSLYRKGKAPAILNYFLSIIFFVYIKPTTYKHFVLAKLWRQITRPFSTGDTLIKTFDEIDFALHT